MRYRPFGCWRGVLPWAAAGRHQKPASGSPAAQAQGKPGPPQPSPTGEITYQQVLGALNHLSDAASQVLGKTIVTKRVEVLLPGFSLAEAI